MPAPLLSFDGLGNLFGGWPPDTQGDIGPNHYVQWINLHFAIWEIDRGNPMSATLVYGPAPGNTLFTGIGGLCESTNRGDPITLYDSLAGRWFMSQFAFVNDRNGPYAQCVAVSQTSDPTGAWHRYEFNIPVSKLNDYPKFGVWPDAFYMTVNQFNTGSMSWGGAGVAALDRQAMLIGDPASMLYIDLYSVNPSYGGILPADLDGATPPPSGAPGIFAEWDDGGWIPPQDALRLWEFDVDWSNPLSSTFGVSGNPNLTLATDNVNPNMCSYSRNCIPQPGTFTKLDAISDRLMHRLQYRNFGSYQTLVVNHTVDATGADQAGIHWLELRNGGAGWSVHQEGVYSPDSANRWMGSVAMDKQGNLALGFSLSSGSISPSVGYAGRLAGDPPGTLPQGEALLVSGGGSQTGASRWGDYSMMAVDPVDDCTFWYTQEYVQTTGTNTWKTRIGAFRFPTCTQQADGWLQGVVRDANTSDPINLAEVEATSPPTLTLSTLTAGNGAYSLQVPVGAYTVTASAYGYMPQTVSDVQVLSGTITTQDFDLTPADFVTVTGTVRDALTGWPIYARLGIINAPIPDWWTNPVSGAYQVSLLAGFEYEFQVQAWGPGYLPVTRTVGPLTTDQTEDFDLIVDMGACQAMGYLPGVVLDAGSDLPAMSSPQAICEPQTGGLVVGNVSDENTAQPLLGALVENPAGFETLTASTMDDPAVDEGLYVLFSPAGAQDHGASLEAYQTITQTVQVLLGDAVRQDFHLPAGLLEVTPVSLQATLYHGTALSLPLTLTNQGGAPLTFEISEIEGSYWPLSLSPKPHTRKIPGGAEGSRIYLENSGPLLTGTALFIKDAQSTAGQSCLLGVEYALGSFWVTSGGDQDCAGLNYLFQMDPDMNLVHAWLQPTTSQYGWRDLSFDGEYLYASDSDVIVQINPVNGQPTGVTIPSPTNPGRGLAYDPATDHFWVANFDDDLYEIDRSGAVLHTIANLFPQPLAIYGLAWDASAPGGASLWAWSQDGTPPVLATQFDVATGELTGIHFTGVSLAGSMNLAGGATVSTDIITGKRVFIGLHQADSDSLVGYDLDALDNQDVPWLSVTPVSGTLSSASSLSLAHSPQEVGFLNGDTQVVAVTFDASGPEVIQPGEYKATLRISNDAPYGIFFSPVTLTIQYRLTFFPILFR